MLPRRCTCCSYFMCCSVGLWIEMVPILSLAWPEETEPGGVRRADREGNLHPTGRPTLQNLCSCCCL